MNIQLHINKKENQRCWSFYQIKEMRKQVIHTISQFISPKSSLDFNGERLYSNKRERYRLN